MTTIIGIQRPKHCVIAGDALVTGADGRPFVHTDMPKVVRVGAFIIAGAGLSQPCDLLAHTWRPPKLTKEAKKDTYHFVLTKVIPSIRKCLTDGGYNWNQEASGEYNFQFLLAVNGQLFDIDDDLAVTRSEDGLYAIGSGGKYALGAMACGADWDVALDIASRFNIYTRAPFMKMVQSVR